MTAANESISLRSFSTRMARKLAEPGVVKALVQAAISKPETAMSLGLLLEQRAAEQPHATAIKFYGEQWTWMEFNAWANRYAHYYQQHGIRSGDAIAINISNRPEVLVAVCAAAKLGAVAAMINTSQTGDVLKHSLGLVSPKLIITGSEQLDNMASVQELLDSDFKDKLLYVADSDAADSPVPKGYLDLAVLSAGINPANPLTTAKVTLSQPCFYIFTSGTTGLPKASIMTHLRWHKAATLMGKVILNLTADDTFYCCLPFYHNNALTLGLGSVLSSGAAMAISRKFSASRFWDEVREYEATAFCYIGELLRYLLNQPEQASDSHHKVRAVLGNGLRPDVWDEFKARFGIDRVHEFYGASEGSNAFVNLLNYDKTCGLAPGGWKIVEYDVDADEPVTDKKGRLKVLGKGDVGLLITEVSDRMPFDGYTNKEAGEKKLLRNAIKKGDCWFNTGDLVRSQGFSHIQFVDRVGDTFRWQGENVATTQVEAAIIEWHQTEDAVVYGVEVPNRDGRCGMVSYTMKAGETLDAEGFAAHLRKSLPKYAIPRFLRLQPNQDVTGTFKHQKAKLKKQGYDLDTVAEPLHFLATDSDNWQPLTAELVSDIASGKAKI